MIPVAVLPFLSAIRLDVVFALFHASPGTPEMTSVHTKTSAPENHKLFWARV